MVRKARSTPKRTGKILKRCRKRSCFHLVIRGALIAINVQETTGSYIYFHYVECYIPYPCLCSEYSVLERVFSVFPGELLMSLHNMLKVLRKL